VVGTHSDIKNLPRQIEGGYVQTPHKGFFHSISCYDYASLYPTTIRQFNISPDVYLGQKESLSQEILDNNIVTASGAVFKSDVDGFYRTILTKVYQDRKDQKKLMGKYDSDIDKLKAILKEKEKELILNS
jgi:DNA polymerase elongation subunit (family B)